MAKWGKMDYKAFEKMANNFEEAVKKDIGEQLVTDILLEVGNKVLAKTKKRTPVGQYSGQVSFMANIPEKQVNFTTKAGKKVSFKAKARTRQVRFSNSKTQVGGTLRKGWYITGVKKNGNKLFILIYNNVEYASFVEYGHRKRNNKGWVEGRFMLTISMKEVEHSLQQIADKHCKKVLEQLFK